MGAEAGDIGLTIHPHPTLSETVNFAADDFGVGEVALVGAVPAPNLTSGRGGLGPDYRPHDWARAIRFGQDR